MRLAYVSLVFFSLAGTCFAGPTSIPAYKVTSPPIIDGVIHEDGEWKGVPSVSGLYDEQSAEKASDGATFWVGYDDKFIYVAARMVDSQPALIRAAQYQTNVSLSGDDYFQFDLDLSGTTTDFSFFQVNPKGGTNTLLAGGRGAKREWAGEFEAASRITATGWETEMRIPWQEMALPSAGIRDLRINFERYVGRSQRSFSHVYVGDGAGKNPIWQHVQIPRSDFDHSIKLLPYFYAGYDNGVGSIFNSGLDLKTSLTDQVQLVGSVNPDFRNIENQILSLDFSRFQRLAGESRPFFLEGSQYLGSALFASQEIPSFDVGVNSYGKITDQTSFGFLNTTQFGHQNDFVANLTTNPDPDSSYRFGVTNLEAAGLSNSSYLARYQRNWGPYGVFFRDMGSQDELVGRGDNLNGALFYFANGLSIYNEYSQVTPNFLPRLGFFPEVDYKGPDGSFYYDKPWNHGAFNDAGASFSYVDYDHMDGSDYRREATYSAFGTLRNGFLVSAIQDFAQFEGSDDHTNTVIVSYPRTNPYDNVAATYAWGQEAGYRYDSKTISWNRRFFNKLQVIGRYQAVRYEGYTDQTILDLNYDLGKNRAVYGRLTKQGNDLNGYLAYRLSGNLGTEYYVILGDPNALTFHASLILKVAIPFVVGQKTKG